MVSDKRIAVEHVLAMLAAGESTDTVLREYPSLESEDIQACLTFAHRAREPLNKCPIPLPSAGGVARSAGEETGRTT